ncbi:hypothetical protein ACF09Y_35040 [Streptomyces massasporeus]|uniref:hypothetical protein n=1 Tax=Streptomyces massasporeus TaxID=67324 RepID=UPI0036F80D85
MKTTEAADSQVVPCDPENVQNSTSTPLLRRLFGEFTYRVMMSLVGLTAGAGALYRG